MYNSLYYMFFNINTFMYTNKKNNFLLKNIQRKAQKYAYIRKIIYKKKKNSVYDAIVVCKNK